VEGGQELGRRGHRLGAQNGLGQAQTEADEAAATRDRHKERHRLRGRQDAQIGAQSVRSLQDSYRLRFWQP